MRAVVLRGAEFWHEIFGAGSEKAQSSVEVLAVAILVVTLLFFVVVTIQQRNSEADSAAAAAMASIQCNAISETIANVYNNRATTEQVLVVQKNATIQRSGTGPGVVTVGSSTCYYIGAVDGEEGGIMLSEYKQYKFSSGNSGVIISEVST